MLVITAKNIIPLPDFKRHEDRLPIINQPVKDGTNGEQERNIIRFRENASTRDRICVREAAINDPLTRLSQIEVALFKVVFYHRAEDGKGNEEVYIAEPTIEDRLVLYSDVSGEEVAPIYCDLFCIKEE